MLFIKCEINVPTLSTFEGSKTDSYAGQIRKTVRKHVALAMAAFVREAERAVPKRTGFAASALLNLRDAAGVSRDPRLPDFDVGGLADFTRLAREVLKRDGPLGIREKSIPGREYYYPGNGAKVLKTPKAGRAFGTPTDKIVREVGNGDVVFQFAVDVSYYNIQDVRAQRSPTSPWHSFERGRLAFVRTMEKLAGSLENFPTLEGFLQTTTVTVDESGTRTRKQLFTGG